MNGHRMDLGSTVFINPDEAGIFDLVAEHRNWNLLANEINQIASTAVPGGHTVISRDYVLDAEGQRTVVMITQGPELLPLHLWSVTLKVVE